MISPASLSGRALSLRRLICPIVTLGLALHPAAQVNAGRARPPAQVLQGFAVLNQPKSRSNNETGPPVRMPVSLNIDRHLIKAQGFLDRSKFSSAFKVLQDVIEGRTLTDDTGATKPEVETPDSWDISSAQQAVFSNDERTYHSVRRLCHQLLASLPPEGIAAYRSEFEFDAERAYEAGRANGDVNALEQVFELYFATLSAARALEFAGDLRMDRGQFRAALKNYRTLLEVYPEQGRRAAGIDDSYVLFKTALCYAQLGDSQEVSRQLEELRSLAPGTTLRIMGELVSADELEKHPLFAESARAAAAKRVSLNASADIATFIPGSELVPLWEFRYQHTRPYRIVRESKSRGRVQVRSGTSGVSLSPTLYVPGTSAVFLGDRIAFLDHFRVRTHEALSGRMLLEAASEPLGEKLKPGRPRARVPAYDFATSKVRATDDSLFAVLGKRRPRDLEALLANRIVAYDRETMIERWSTEASKATAKLTYLASPTVLGNKLLVPVLDHGTFALQCLDTASGAPIYRVPIHRGGTTLARPIASPVAISDGVAFVLSNAGAIASIDAHTGTLNWIRRYERLHPLRPSKIRGSRNRNNRNMFGGVQTYTEISRLPGFAPSELITHEGLVIFAPCDGSVLCCLDGATGDPVWMLNRIQRIPNATHVARWQYIIGHDGEHLFVGANEDVSCIRLRSGVRIWREELPSVPGINKWRGRGAVVAGHVVMPGTRELLVRKIEAPNGTPWTRLALPELSIGREPLDGPFNISADGAMLTASYEGGLEVYSTVDSLTKLATSTDVPERRSLLQSQAGDMLAAFKTLEAVDFSTIEDADRRGDIIKRLLSIASELSLAMAAHGARDDATNLLTRCRAKLTESRDVMRWHLARIEMFQTLGDLDGVEAEQVALYALMEGR